MPLKAGLTIRVGIITKMLPLKTSFPFQMGKDPSIGLVINLCVYRESFYDFFARSVITF
jgi:hypothetical protein